MVKFLTKTTIFSLLIFLSIGISACFREAVYTRKPIPDMIWPDPPEVPRIRLLNVIITPEDLNIRSKMRFRIIRYIKGEKILPIVSPYGITMDNEGRLYVVDTFYRIVHVFDEKSGDYYTFPKGEIQFTSPIDITADEMGRLYVTDSMKAVVKIFDKGGKRYLQDLGKGIFSRPTGIVYNPVSKEILVVDTKSSQIIRYDVNTLHLKGIIGQEGMGDGQFYSPVSICVMKNGNIIISDSLNFRIQILTSKGDFIRSFGAAGDAPGYFSRPKGIAVDSDGNIYIVDALFDNVQIFNNQGRFLMAFGKPGNDYGEFWLPSGIYIDEEDRIYVSDTYNHRIQVFQYLKESEVIEK